MSKPPADCHPTKQAAGRGLCSPCYHHHRNAGTLADFPRRGWTQSEFVEEYKRIDGHRYTFRQVAEQVGLTLAAATQQILRAKRKGLL